MGLLKGYQDVFSQEDGDVGCTSAVKHRIRLADDIPVKQPDRRVPPLIVPEVEDITGMARPKNHTSK